LYWEEDINVLAVSKQINPQDSHRSTDASGIESAPIVIMTVSTLSVFWEEGGCQLDIILYRSFLTTCSLLFNKTTPSETLFTKKKKFSCIFRVPLGNLKVGNTLKSLA
jgi:hypothetical protein